MVKWHSPQDEIDEHDLPTEPIYIGPAPGSEPDEPTVPFPPASPPAGPSWMQPLPQQQQKMVLPSPPAQPAANVYPILPPAPVQQNRERPRWEKQPLWGGTQAPKAKDKRPDRRKNTPQPTSMGQPQRARRRGRSPIPAYVSFFLLVAQLILCASFVLQLLNLPNPPQWVSTINELAGLLVRPLHTIVQQFNLAFTINAYIYILLAIVFYHFLSRIVVGFLKVVLR